MKLHCTSTGNCLISINLTLSYLCTCIVTADHLLLLLLSKEWGNVLPVSICLCLPARLLIKLWTEFDEILWMGEGCVTQEAINSINQQLYCLSVSQSRTRNFFKDIIRWDHCTLLTFTRWRLQFFAALYDVGRPLRSPSVCSYNCYHWRIQAPQLGEGGRGNSPLLSLPLLFPSPPSPKK